MTTVCPRCLHRYDLAHAMAGPGDGLCPDCREAMPPPRRPLGPAALSAADRAALALALPAGVRAALDAAALEDVPRETLDALIRAVTGGPRAVPGGLLYLQCHGYLYPEEDDAVL